MSTVDVLGSGDETALQHMKLQGRVQVYPMARFVGEEWEKALREAAQR